MQKIFLLFSLVIIYSGFVFSQEFQIAPESLNFGSIIVGSDSILQVTVSNPDTSDLVITNITSTNGQFTFTPNTFPITILAGGNQVIDVTFTPTTVGLNTDSLIFAHNATGSPTVYSVEGTGVAPGFSISPVSLNFGSVVVGSNAMLQATVNNAGTSDLVITNITSTNGQFTFTPNTFPITILAGGNQVIDVTFTPATVGLNTDSLIFTHNATGSPTVYSVEGTGVAPGFSISPVSLNFGSVVVGSNAMLQATVNNAGTSDLVITNITSTNGQFTFTPNTFPITILAGGNQVIDVTFTPATVGLNTDSLIFTHNATGSPTVYSIEGTGVAPGFSISPVSLNFGSVVVGSNAMLQATVNNAGTSDLVITNITSTNGQFTFTPNTFPITILAGGNQVIDVTFTPSSVGLNTDSLIFTHNATGSPTVYSVEGTGVAPGFSISPVSLNFGSVVVGSNAMLQATVNNAGTSDLVITNITSTNGQFTFTPNTFPITILAGGNQIIDVTFTPSSVGLNTDSLIFTHNATGSPTVYSVEGTGVAPGFSISPVSLNFGSVVVGSNAMLQATVNNAGTSDLVITNITSTNGQFTFTPNTFPITILAGGNQIIDVTFTPSSVGLNTDSLIFTHNATGSPTVYSVEGTGVAPGFSISPVSLNFGSVVVGSNAMLQATVNNAGTSDLVITNITSTNGQFTFTPNTFPITILAGGNQIIDVTFTPATVGLNTDSLIFTHNATGSPTVYSVEGTGVAPGFSISPVSLNFGSVVVGSNAMLQATVNNAGTSDLVITNITSTNGQFTFTPNTFPITILAGGNQVIDVTFTPATVGLNTDSLIFTHNATGSPTVYSITGGGIEAIGTNPNEVNLINVITSSVNNTLMTVWNNSNNPFLIESVITGTSNWTITPDTATIPAGDSVIFNLTFSAPAVPGTYTGTLELSTASFPSKTIPLSAIVVLDAGIIFEQDTVYRLEDNSYMNVMQLKSLTDPLHAIQFRLQVNKELDDNIILSFLNIQKGTDVSDSSWILVYNVVRGPITPNGASKDEVFVLLYNINQGVGLPPGNYNEMFRVNYRVANLNALQDSVKSTFKITNAEGSTFEGLPINVSPSQDILTVIATNRISWRGDINLDGYLDILDLLMVDDHIVNIDSLRGGEFLRGDIAPWFQGTPAPIPNGIINVQELSLIQNIILTGVYPDGTPTAPVEYPLLSKTNDDGEAKVTFYINERGITIYLDSNIGIRGAQIELTNVGNEPSGMVIRTDLGQGYYYYLNSDKILRTLLYDPAGQKFIGTGKHLLAEMPFTLTNPKEISLDNLILVDVNREKVLNLQVEIIFKDPTLPDNYMLAQNYPNPFNPSTTIEFSLPEDVNNVSLSIYNVLGEKVDQLINTSMAAGNYQYQWIAKDQATGMYIYELRTEKFVQVKKMILLK